MRTAAPRFFPRLGLSAWLTACWLSVAVAAPRSMPTRPGAARHAPVVARGEPPRTGEAAPKMALVNLSTAAAALGLKFSVDPSGRKITLAGRSHRAEFEVDSREAGIDGLRVFLGDSVRAGHGEFYVSRVDYAACLVPLLRPALAPPIPEPKVVAIDAGHGGADNGMENKALGLKEKVLTLDVALRLRRLLEARGYRVVMTRTGDAALNAEKLKDFDRRIAAANAAGADLFVSIHFNSLYPDRKTGGTEIYTFTRAGQRSDRSWGLGEADDAERTPSPVNRFDAGTSLLAASLHRAVIAELKTYDRGQKTMHSAVLRGLNCPAVLVESVFLSNDREAKLAATAAYRQRIADALAQGIEDYGDAVRAQRAKRAKR